MIDSRMIAEMPGSRIECRPAHFLDTSSHTCVPIARFDDLRMHDFMVDEIRRL